MSKTTVASPAAKTIGPLAPVDPTSLRALTTTASMIEIDGIWQTLLTKMVFDIITLPDKGDRVTFPKRLMTPKAKGVLTIIWVSSAYLTDCEVDASGLSRLGDASSPLNCHKMARVLALTASELDKEEKQIQNIVEAAEAYGLVTREQFKKTRTWALRGTRALHDLMMANSKNCYDLCADVAASEPEGI